MSNDVAINKESAPAKMAEILSETDSFLADMEAGYNELACSFFQTLLQMMQAAEAGFGTLDQKYAEEKIK